MQGLYSQVNYNLKKAMYNVGSTSGSNYLTFLLNRSEASKLYLDAFEKGIQVQNIKQDSVGKFSSAQQLSASVICNDALSIFNKYLQKHVELMPDRGCEGTLINFWHAPIYGLKVIRNKYAGNLQKKHNTFHSHSKVIIYRSIVSYLHTPCCCYVVLNIFLRSLT